ncbi:MAG TPA: hypothetical protein PKW55_02525 [Spirochaetota bacterium]|nr:hypothetical protein [Spirochaetota bacterium]HOM38276.1 hypothetical protein [Spirochaetota bacterium]HPQ48506.1 hypothetical protein [Spirochaetota bacterium]
MRKILSSILFIFILNISYGKVLGKVDLPEGWEIKSSETKDNYKIDDFVVSKYIVQTIKTNESEAVVEYLIFDNFDTLVKVFFSNLFNKKSIYLDLNSKTTYIIEGTPVDRKNILRFLRLPILEQIKVVYKDIEDAEKFNLEIIKESDLNNNEINNITKDFGVSIERAKEQVFKVKEGIGISVIYFLCKNSNDANIAYKNARIKNTSDLMTFLMSQNFLIRLTWVKI